MYKNTNVYSVVCYCIQNTITRHNKTHYYYKLPHLNNNTCIISIQRAHSPQNLSTRMVVQLQINIWCQLNPKIHKCPLHRKSAQRNSTTCPKVLSTFSKLGDVLNDILIPRSSKLILLASLHRNTFLPLIIVTIPHCSNNEHWTKLQIVSYRIFVQV